MNPDPDQNGILTLADYAVITITTITNHLEVMSLVGHCHKNEPLTHAEK